MLILDDFEPVLREEDAASYVANMIQEEFRRIPLDSRGNRMHSTGMPHHTVREEG